MAIDANQAFRDVYRDRTRELATQHSALLSRMTASDPRRSTPRQSYPFPESVPSYDTEILEKINTKAMKMMEDYNVTATTAIIDAASYEKLCGATPMERINTQVGQLNFVVLPQAKTRIQVVGSIMDNLYIAAKKAE